MNKELITSAAQYWANFFSNPKYSDKMNGGLDGFDSILATFSRLSLNESIQILPEQIENFKKSIEDYLEKELLKEKTPIILSTDWYPEFPLSSFLVENNLPGTYFPNKTIMFIYKDRYSVQNLGKEFSFYPK